MLLDGRESLNDVGVVLPCQVGEGAAWGLPQRLDDPVAADDVSDALRSNASAASSAAPARRSRAPSIPWSASMSASTSSSAAAVATLSASSAMAASSCSSGRLAAHNRIIRW